jgi:hypothetical protein
MLPADGTVYTFLLQDSEELACQTTQLTSSLSPCSNSCEVEVQVVSYDCFDNGTESDATDDYYEITIQGVVVNGSGNTGFELTVDGVVNGNYNYNEDIVITLPADNITHTLAIEDNDSSGCDFSLTTVPLNPCSTNCEVSVDIQYSCDNNGTESDPTDDIITVTITSTAFNGATNNRYNLYINGALDGIYDYGNPVVKTYPANGQVINMRAQDSQDLACQLIFATDALNPCSDGCLIGIDLMDIICDNNSTTTDITDDIYTIEFTGEVLNGIVSSGFMLYVDGVLEGTYNYGDLVTIMIDADEMSHTIRIDDEGDPNCSDEFITDVLTTCSTDCEILTNELVYDCSDNGTPTDSSDDIVTVTFTAEAVNGATNNSFNLYINNLLDGVYNYGTEINLEFPADGQAATIRLQDSQSLPCQLQFMTDALNSCSDGCLISFVIEDSQCDNNGTTTDVNDDFYIITISAEVLNGAPSATYTLFVDGVSSGINNYNQQVNINLPADGTIHNIEIVDSNDPTCTYQLPTDVLTSCSTDCEILADFVLIMVL